MNGGPCSSSMFGAFVENGPFHFDSNGTLVDNPYSWNNRASVLFLDQPVVCAAVRNDVIHSDGVLFPFSGHWLFLYDE